MEPRFNDLRYNDIRGIKINIRLPSKSYSKMYGVESRHNDLQYNDIPRFKDSNVVDRAQNIPVITIKSIPQTTENANIG